MSAVALTHTEFLASAQRIAEEVAGPHAADVDRDARFPAEAIDAIRDARLLSVLVPVELGGGGATISDVAEMTRALGAHCASTALVFAIHQVQVACVVRHGHTPLLREFLAELADSQYLLGSATTEAGIGDDIRTSVCAVRAGSRFTLRKAAPVISYGAYADAIMATARRSPESASADQILVLCRAPG